MPPSLMNFIEIAGNQSLRSALPIQLLVPNATILTPRTMEMLYQPLFPECNPLAGINELLRELEK